MAPIVFMKSVGYLSLYQIKLIYPPPLKSVAVTVADCRRVNLTLISTVKSVAKSRRKSQCFAVTVIATVKIVELTVKSYSQSVAKCRSDCSQLQSKVSQVTVTSYSQKCCK